MAGPFRAEASRLVSSSLCGDSLCVPLCFYGSGRGFPAPGRGCLGSDVIVRHLCNNGRQFERRGYERRLCPGRGYNRRLWHNNRRLWHNNRRLWHNNRRLWHNSRRLWHNNRRLWHNNRRLWHNNRRHWHNNRRLWRDRHFQRRGSERRVCRGRRCNRWFGNNDGRLRRYGRHDQRVRRGAGRSGDFRNDNGLLHHRCGHDRRVSGGAGRNRHDRGFQRDRGPNHRAPRHHPDFGNCRAHDRHLDGAASRHGAGTAPELAVELFRSSGPTVLAAELQRAGPE
jgi:hypothetical protein